MKVDYTDKVSLKNLASVLGRLSSPAKAKIVDDCMEQRLMRAPFSLRVIKWILIKFYGKKRYKESWAKISVTNKSASLVIDDFWYQTLDHMVNGKDYLDSKSAGGFCKKELDNFISVIMYHAPEILVENNITYHFTKKPEVFDEYLS